MLTTRDSPTSSIPTSVPQHQLHHYSFLSKGPAQAQSPISSGRQDSFFPRFETANGRPSTATSPRPQSASTDSHLVASPTAHSSLTTATSSRPIAHQPYASQSSPISTLRFQPPNQTSRRSNSGPLSSSAQNPTPPSIKTVERIPTSAPTHPHIVSKSMQESVTLEPLHRSQTRQQRYSVRFAPNYSVTNYLSANMTPTQKAPRASPPVTPVSPESPVGTVEPAKPPVEQQPMAGPVEPSLVTRKDIRNMTEPAQDQPYQQCRSPSVERCMGCHEAWKRPLPEFHKPTGINVTKTNNDLATSNMSIIEQLRAHGRNAEIMHDKWRERHYHCVPREKKEPPPKLDPWEARSPGCKIPSRDSKPAPIASSKRRLEHSLDPEQANSIKSRKIAFEGA